MPSIKIHADWFNFVAYEETSCLKTVMCKSESQQCYKSEDLMAVSLKAYRKHRDFASRSNYKANGNT